MNRMLYRVFWLGVIGAFFLQEAPGRAMEGAGGGESNPFAAVNGQAGANAFTGGASVSIPIVVPPGRPLATPSLALSYSSQAGLSPVGVGWNLAIGTLARDAKRGVPRCGGPNMNDFNATLSASGNILVESSPDVYMQKIDEEYTKAIPDRNQNK